MTCGSALCQRNEVVVVVKVGVFRLRSSRIRARI